MDVQPRGRVFITGREVQLSHLNQEVARLLASPNPQSERIMIRADRLTRYADFMTVMNTLQGGGFTRVGLISEDL